MTRPSKKRLFPEPIEFDWTKVMLIKTGYATMLLKMRRSLFFLTNQNLFLMTLLIPKLKNDLFVWVKRNRADICLSPSSLETKE